MGTALERNWKFAFVRASRDSCEDVGGCFMGSCECSKSIGTCKLCINEFGKNVCTLRKEKRLVHVVFA